MFVAPDPNIKVFGPPPDTNIWFPKNWDKSIKRKQKIEKIYGLEKTT